MVINALFGAIVILVGAYTRTVVSRVDKLETRIESLEREHGEHKAVVSGVGFRYETLERIFNLQIDPMRRDLEQAKTDIRSIATAVSNLQNNIGKLHKAMESIVEYQTQLRTQ